MTARTTSRTNEVMCELLPKPPGNNKAMSSIYVNNVFHWVNDVLFGGCMYVVTCIWRAIWEWTNTGEAAVFIEKLKPATKEAIPMRIMWTPRFFWTKQQRIPTLIQKTKKNTCPKKPPQLKQKRRCGFERFHFLYMLQNVKYDRRQLTISFCPWVVECVQGPKRSECTNAAICCFFVGWLVVGCWLCVPGWILVVRCCLMFRLGCSMLLVGRCCCFCRWAVAAGHWMWLGPRCLVAGCRLRVGCRLSSVAASGVGGLWFVVAGGGGWLFF